jgi:quercetin dioxygenase-like cupin family protein
MSKVAAERIQVGKLEVLFHADRAHTGGHADVYEVRIPEGAKVPAPHFHVDVDEVIMCLEGHVTYTIGSSRVTLAPGELAHSPRGIVHHFDNRHAGTARFVITATPARMGPEYFREVGAVLSAGGPPDLAKVKVVMEKYGLEMAPLPADVRDDPSAAVGN